MASREEVELAIRVRLEEFEAELKRMAPVADAEAKRASNAILRAMSETDKARAAAAKKAAAVEAQATDAITRSIEALAQIRKRAERAELKGVDAIKAKYAEQIKAINDLADAAVDAASERGDADAEELALAQAAAARAAVRAQEARELADVEAQAQAAAAAAAEDAAASKAKAAQALEAIEQSAVKSTLTGVDAINAKYDEQLKKIAELEEASGDRAKAEAARTAVEKARAQEIVEATGETEKAWTQAGNKIKEIAGDLAGEDFKKVSEAVSKVAEAVGVSEGTLIALGVTAGVAAGAVLALAGVVWNTVHNIDDLADSLGEADRQRLKPYISRVREANDALEEMDQAGTRLSIMLTSHFADDVAHAANAATGFATALERVSEALGGPSAKAAQSGWIAFLNENARFSRFGVLGMVADVSAAYGASEAPAVDLGVVGPREQQQRGLEELGLLDDGRAKEIADTNKRNAEETRRAADQAREKAAAAAERLEADILDYVDKTLAFTARLEEEAAAAAKEKAEAAADATTELAEITREYTEALLEGEEAIRARYDLELELIDELEVRSGDILAAEQARVAVLKALETELAEHRIAEAERASEEQEEKAREVLTTTQGYLQAAGTFAASISDLVVGIYERQADAAVQSSAREREARLKAFKAAKAAALVQAAINMALAVTQALSGPFPLNYINAALVTAAGAVQIGLIASKQPPTVAHRGLAPDEVSITAQRGEGILSRQGVAALGGPEGVTRANRGESVGGDGPMVIAAVYEHRVLDTMVGASLRRSNSALRGALREAGQRAGIRVPTGRRR